jgi:hypothetical protein
MGLTDKAPRGRKVFRQIIADVQLDKGRAHLASGQQRVKRPGVVERVNVITAADMLAADENLGNSPAAIGAACHRLAQAGVVANVDFLESHALLGQEPLGGDAIGTSLGRIDLNRFHERNPWAIGRLY